jgi:uncharacterized protein YkwD
MLSIRPAVLVLALALAGCGGEPVATGPIDARFERQVAATRLDPGAAVAALTAYRASHDLGAVRLDPALTAMAQRQADAMVAANTLSHNVAGAFTTRLASAGVDAPEAGENLGGGYFSLDHAMAGWRGSSEHNANLLMRNATRIGIAIAKDPRTRYGVYWALELAAEPQQKVLTTSDARP